MGVALIGGMDRLKPEYVREAKKAGLKLKVFTGKENKISDRIGNVGYMILITNKVSHAARREAISTAKSRNIPVYQFHSSGVSTLRDCFQAHN